MRSPIVGRKIVARIPPVGYEEPLGSYRDRKAIEGPCQVVEYRGGWASFARDIELHEHPRLAGYRKPSSVSTEIPAPFSATCKRAEPRLFPAAKMNGGPMDPDRSPTRWATWPSSWHWSESGRKLWLGILFAVGGDEAAHVVAHP